MRRGEDPDWWQPDPQYRANRLAVRLARTLSVGILAREGVEITTDEILHLDSTACGHTDYSRRMSVGVQNLIDNRGL